MDEVKMKPWAMIVGSGLYYRNNIKLIRKYI